MIPILYDDCDIMGLKAKHETELWRFLLGEVFPQAQETWTVYGHG